jgi:hypothetical protein
MLWDDRRLMLMSSKGLFQGISGFLDFIRRPVFEGTRRFGNWMFLSSGKKGEEDTYSVGPLQTPDDGWGPETQKYFVLYTIVTTLQKLRVYLFHIISIYRHMV